MRSRRPPHLKTVLGTLFTFTRTGVTTGALTANFTIGGTATFNTDYTQTGAATFTSTQRHGEFAAGSSTATVTIDPTADTTVEPDETVILTWRQVPVITLPQ